MKQLSKTKYLKGKELRKVTELNDHMRQAESIDAVAWYVIVLCVILFILFGAL